MSEGVRPAEPDDADTVGILEDEARRALAAQRGGAILLAEQDPVGDWAAAIASDRQRVFVAEIDGVVLGYLQLLIDAGRATVRQVYLDPGARELGFGSDLLELAIEAAREAGCTAIEGTALPGDRETKNLYERAGITARKITVWRAL